MAKISLVYLPLPPSLPPPSPLSLSEITVFRYLEDKDVFQKFYSRMLSRRLVFNNSISMEAEENMIQKLKVKQSAPTVLSSSLKHVCGYEYTARLQRMLVDMTLSSNLVAEFHEALKVKEESLKIGFSSLVLQVKSFMFA